jgi:hypothetical protein
MLKDKYCPQCSRKGFIDIEPVPLDDATLYCCKSCRHVWEERFLGGRRVLFLDDRSHRFRAAIEHFKKDDLTIVCTVAECIEKITNEVWDEIWLDHDLNYESHVDSKSKDCGMEIIRFIREHVAYLCGERGWDQRSPLIVIHSTNESGALMMKKTLEHVFNVHQGRITGKKEVYE